jgi:hypothetical protein
MDALDSSKIFQILHEARWERSEQLSQLCQLQIPIRTYVKNHGTDSIFESSITFPIEPTSNSHRNLC